MANALRHHILRAASGILIIALVASCRSNKNAVRVGAGDKSYPTAPALTDDIPEPTRRLISEAERWLGTPYRYGGTERGRGADCSGMVMTVYKNALAIKLPRNSAQMQQWCTPLKDGYRKAMPGDLVFFAGRRGVNHVGIYVGGGKMIHSSSSKGVIVSSLDEPYFVKTFHSAGRVEPYFAMLDDYDNKKKRSEEKHRDTSSDKPAATISLDQLAQASMPAKESKPEQPAPPIKNKDKNSRGVTKTDKKNEPLKKAMAVAPATKPKIMTRAVTETPDTALTPDEARRRLLLRLAEQTDSI